MKRYIDEIYILGDIHGEWKILNKFLRRLDKTKRIAVIACGDFCFWEQAASLRGIQVPENIEIFSCPGNHEDWDTLDTYGYDITEVKEHIFYMPFGSQIQFIYMVNGRETSWNFMFCGGADSIDKYHRTIGVSWWPQEVISYKDMNQLNPNDTVDVLISHAAPTLFDLGNHYKNTDSYKDPSRDALDEVWRMYRPSKWFFGHYHMLKRDYYQGTQWMCLGESRMMFDKWIYKFI